MRTRKRIGSSRLIGTGAFFLLAAEASTFRVGAFGPGQRGGGYGVFGTGRMALAF